MLDGRALRRWRRAAPTCSSTAPGRCGPRPSRCSTGSTSTGCTATRTATTLGLNEIGRVDLPLHRAAAGRRLHDEPGHRQLHHHRPGDQRHRRAPGVIRVIATTHASPNVVRHGGRLPRAERFAALGTAGATLLFTGLSGAGKSTLASGVEEAFVNSGRPAFLLDGDNLRHGLNGDLGFSDRDRTENVRRAGEVARMFAESGALALIALICPFEEDRRLIRTLHDRGGAGLRGGLRRHLARGVRAPRPQGPLRPGPLRASCPGSPASTRPTRCPPTPTWCSGPARARSPSRSPGCSSCSKASSASSWPSRTADSGERPEHGGPGAPRHAGGGPTRPRGSGEAQTPDDHLGGRHRA